MATAENFLGSAALLYDSFIHINKPTQEALMKVLNEMVTRVSQDDVPGAHAYYLDLLEKPSKEDQIDWHMVKNTIGIGCIGYTKNGQQTLLEVDKLKKMYAAFLSFRQDYSIDQ